MRVVVIKIVRAIKILSVKRKKRIDLNFVLNKFAN